MADTFAKVRPGQKLRIPASTYNAMVDAARDYAARKNSGGAATARSAPNLVRVKNTSGSDLSRFAVLGVDGVVFEASEDQFKNSIALVGVLPSGTNHSNGRFVICGEPIADGAYGFAIATGISQVQINIADESHCFADVTDGDCTQLASAESGPVVIIWKEAGTGPNKWAIIRFGGSGGGEAVQTEWGLVIEEPVYADPASFDLAGGRGYYNIRLVGAQTNKWVPSTTYPDGAIVQYPDVTDPSYKAKHPNGDSGENVGHNPSTDTDWWQKVDDIRVEHALGMEGIDIRLFTPWFQKGAVVPLISREISGIGTRYFIWAALDYGGTSDQASIRWNQTEKRSMACYK